MVTLKEKEIGAAEENIRGSGARRVSQRSAMAVGNAEEEFFKWTRSLANGDTRCL